MNLLAHTPCVLAYQGTSPIFAGPVLRAGVGSAVLGRVTMGANAVLGAFAVLRADGHVIEVGDDFHLGARSTVHIAHEVYGTTIGNCVSVGKNTVVHACTVGDDCVIQDNVAVLDGAVIGDGSVVAEGSVVFPRTVLPAGQWCEGVPAVPVRAVKPADLGVQHERIRGNTDNTGLPDGADAGASPALPHAACSVNADSKTPGYVAATVTGHGELRMSAGSSVWFGCVIDVAGAGVDIAADANVQDNSVLRCKERPIVIGGECTVGHNVLMHDCTIGGRVLVGMGSILAPGTVIEDDVLLAAGSTTSPGQVLESGWLWGGRTARPIARLDERKRELIRRSAVTYREYAQEFVRRQAEALRRQ